LAVINSKFWDTAEQKSAEEWTYQKCMLFVMCDISNQNSLKFYFVN